MEFPEKIWNFHGAQDGSCVESGRPGRICRETASRPLHRPCSMYVLCTNRTRGPDGASHQRPSRACQPSRTVQPERGQCNQSVDCATRACAVQPDPTRVDRRDSRDAKPWGGLDRLYQALELCNGRRGWLDPRRLSRACWRLTGGVGRAARARGVALTVWDRANVALGPAATARCLRRGKQGLERRD